MMGFARSGPAGRPAWKDKDRHRCAWRWDPEDRLMRCYECGAARLPTEWEEQLNAKAPGDPERLNIRTEGMEGDA